MKKSNKIRIEKYYLNTDGQGERIYSVIEDFKEANPLLVCEERNLVGFSFLGDDKKIKYYFGQRVTIYDEEGKYITVDLMKKYLREHGFEEAIFLKGGVIITDKVDMAKTIYEVQAETKRKLEESILFDAGEFFEGLGLCLGHAGCDITYTVSDSFWSLSDEIDLGVDEEEVAIRTYIIYEDGYNLLSKAFILGSNKLGNSDCKTFINFYDAMNISESLFLEHPYLSRIIACLKEDVLFSNNVENISDRMLDIAFNVVDGGKNSSESYRYYKTK